MSPTATPTVPGWAPFMTRPDLPCRDADPEMFFPNAGDKATAARAVGVCAGCPARRECLTFALDHDLAYGIWGGTNARWRRKLRRLHRA